MIDHAAAVFRRVVHAIRPARTTTPTDETGVAQRVQVQKSAYEVHESFSMQHFGFASAFPVGTDVMIVNIAGDNSNGVVIASNLQTTRPKGLANGETQLYDNAGQYIHIAQSGTGTIAIRANANITLTCSQKVTVTAPEVDLIANTKVRMVTPRLEVTGDVVDNCDGTGRSMASMRTVFDQHVHTDNRGDVTGVPTPQM